MPSSSHLCCREEIQSCPSLITIRYENIGSDFHYFLVVSISLSLANTTNLEIVIVLLLHLLRYSHIFPLWFKINLPFPFEKREVFNLFTMKPSRDHNPFMQNEKLKCMSRVKNYRSVITSALSSWIDIISIRQVSLFHSLSTKIYFIR